MLGTLARWLRLLGFDTLFRKGKIGDDELLRLAKAEERALITRDRLLAHFARKNRLPLVQINSDKLEEQIFEVAKGLKIKLDKNHFLTRCSLCNKKIRRLTKVKAEQAFNQGLIPEKAYRSSNEFWFCERCSKYYWIGSHWRRIEERIKRIEEDLEKDVKVG
jgi:hypothetical protein